MITEPTLADPLPARVPNDGTTTIGRGFLYNAYAHGIDAIALQMAMKYGVSMQEQLRDRSIAG